MRAFDVEEFVMSFWMGASVLPIFYTPLFLQAIRDGSHENLKRYRETELATLNVHRQSMISIMEEAKIGKPKIGEYVKNLKREIVRDFGIDPESILSVRGLTEFFERKFERTYGSKTRKKQ